METRRDRMARYIDESRAEFQQQPLDIKMLDRVVAQWIERLRYVPDDYLDQCYELAMNDHATRQPLIPKELADKWVIVKQQRGLRPTEFRQEKTCPHWCSEAGWVLVDANGELVKQPSDKTECLYVKPCLIHRSQGFKRDEHAAPWCKGNWNRIKSLESICLPNAGLAVGTTEGWQSAGTVAKEVVQAVAVEYQPTENDITF